MKFVFFLIFYVILGTTGITIPVLISQQFAPNEISIGFITIVMSAIGYNASERIMQLYDSNSRSQKTEMFINLIALVIALLFTIFQSQQQYGFLLLFMCFPAYFGGFKIGTIKIWKKLLLQML